MNKAKSIDTQILNLMVTGLVWLAGVAVVVSTVVTVYEAILLRGGWEMKIGSKVKLSGLAIENGICKRYVGKIGTVVGVHSYLNNGAHVETLSVQFYEDGKDYGRRFEENRDMFESLTEESKWVHPLTAGDWTLEEWQTAEALVFAERLNYPPDSLSAIFRDIAINLQATLTRERKNK